MQSEIPSIDDWVQSGFTNNTKFILSVYSLDFKNVAYDEHDIKLLLRYQESIISIYNFNHTTHQLGYK